MNRKKRALVVWLGLMLGSVTAEAARIEIVIAQPPHAPRAGDRLTLPVFFHNLGSRRVAVKVPVRTDCLVQSGHRTERIVAVVLDPKPEPQTRLAPGGFYKALYQLEIPADMAGTLTLRLPELNQARLIVSVVTEHSPKAGLEGEPAKTSTARPYPTMDTMEALYQPYLGRISAYAPMYFLVGTNPQDSKFQISFKYRFLSAEGRRTSHWPWLSGFHFGYTQTSFWDLSSESQPFEDTSYKPELFYLTSNLTTRQGRLKGLFVQTGVRHESNGRGGDLSRSTNTGYLKTAWMFYSEKTQYGLQVAPKVWTFINNNNETNPDLADYRGYFGLELKAGRSDGFVLGSQLYWAAEGPSVQLDLTYPLHRHLFQHLNVYLQAQYVSVLAESLIDYRERTDAVRLGISIVR